MRGDILGLERRRRWSDEEKLGIVLSVGVEGATVTQVAQRHEVTRQQLQLANGRCLRFNPMLDTTTLTRLIRVVEAA